MRAAVDTDVDVQKMQLVKMSVVGRNLPNPGALCLTQKVLQLFYLPSFMQPQAPTRELDLVKRSPRDQLPHFTTSSHRLT